MNAFNHEIHDASELTGETLCYVTDDTSDIRVDFFDCRLREKGSPKSGEDERYKLTDEIALVIGSGATRKQVLQALNAFQEVIESYGLASTPDLIFGT